MNLGPCVQFPTPLVSRNCLRDAIPEIKLAADLLDEAVSAHLSGQSAQAELLIIRANMPAIREWTESLWGKNSPYVRPRLSHGAKPPIVELRPREEQRMPNPEEQRALHSRDGYHCRFCGIPVIRKAIRVRLKNLYPNALPWGRVNVTQHAAFQAMWAQYDHIIPHANGGTNDLNNVVVTCAPCNYGRMNYSLEELGLNDPRTREAITSTWDGLERLATSNPPAFASDQEVNDAESRTTE